MLQALIVDDEEIATETLQELLQDHCAHIEVVATATSVSEARTYLNNHPIDVLFLDIRMPQETGFDLLRSLANPHEQMVVFVSAYHQYAQEAINADATSYLTKPVDPEELKVLEWRLLRKQRQWSNKQGRGQTPPPKTNQHTSLRIPHQKGFRLLPPETIVSLESDNAYTSIWMDNGEKMVTSKGIHQFEHLLDRDLFLRIHRSFIVNLQHIREYLSEESGYVVMSNGKRYEVSRRRKSAFFDRINSMTRSWSRSAASGL